MSQDSGSSDYEYGEPATATSRQASGSSDDEEYNNSVATPTVINANGAVSYAIDPWNDILLGETFKDTPAADVRKKFEPLYAADPIKAFKYAMMFANLRKVVKENLHFSATLTCKFLDTRIERKFALLCNSDMQIFGYTD